MKPFTARKFDSLLGLSGFSDALLTNHFALYEGYVKNTNALAERLEGYAASEETSAPEYAELKRRFGWEWNGMRLHELYFENLTRNPAALSEGGPLEAALRESFGSFATWEKEFRASGALRGIGWVLLVRDASDGHLFNIWVNEHDLGHLAGTAPLLVMDVFEHAFMLDYGIKRADYIDAFFRNIDWSVAEKRLK